MSKNSNSRGRRRKGRSHKKGSKPKPPVPIHKRSSSHFQPKDRDRGEELVAQGRVDVEMTDTRARAYVDDDDREYAVGFDWTLVPEKRALHGFCECDRFADGTPCEHLWAVLAILGKAGTDKQPAGRDRVSLKKDRAANWGDLDLHEDLQRDGNKRGRGKGKRGGRKGGGPDSWRSLFDSVREEVDRLTDSSEQEQEPDRRLREVRFLVNTSASEKAGGLVLDIFGPAGSRRKGRNLKRIRLRPDELDRLLQPRDGSDAEAVEIGGVVAALPVDSKGRKGGRKQRGGRRGRRGSRRTTIQSVRLPPQLYDSVVPHLCSEGVLGWWNGRNVGNPPTLSWDEEEAWRLALRLDIASGGGARLSGALEHEGQDESVPLSDAKLILAGNGAGSANGRSGLVVFGRSVARLRAASEAELPWIDLLRETGDVVIPEEDLEEALDSLLDLPALPKIETPSELELSVKRSPPQPRLVLEPVSGPSDVEAPLLAELSFVYGGVEVDAGDDESSILDLEKGVYVRRDMELERNALVRLLELGMEPVELSHNHELQINPRELPAVAEPLLLDGWEVEIHGRSLRSPS
ncbi:MAG: SWIM zinc finger family protein, partial [Thermoanaerobaculia bacterium]|nr:SWIM zinc finger family protein [Thermoanaerobaculia bacterium]